MSFGRSRTLFGAALLGALALGAAACSSSPTSATTTTSTASSQAASSGSTAATSGAMATVKVSSDASLGKILVNSAGLALYTYGPDKGHGGMSMCTGGCLSAWPALTVPAGTNPTGGTGVGGTLSSVMQANGAEQVTYDGLPLYTFAQDTPGQVTGNGVGGFSVAKASASGSGSTTASTSSSGGGY